MWITTSARPSGRAPWGEPLECELDHQADGEAGDDLERDKLEEGAEARGSVDEVGLELIEPEVVDLVVAGEVEDRAPDGERDFPARPPRDRSGLGHGRIAFHVDVRGDDLAGVTDVRGDGPELAGEGLYRALPVAFAQEDDRLGVGFERHEGAEENAERHPPVTHEVDHGAQEEHEGDGAGDQRAHGALSQTSPKGDRRKPQKGDGDGGRCRFGEGEADEHAVDDWHGLVEREHRLDVGFTLLRAGGRRSGVAGRGGMDESEHGTSKERDRIT